MTMTEKQKSYRDALIAEQIRKLEAADRGVVLGRDQLAWARLAVALPEPQNAAEASEQIDALKGSMKEYSRNHREWAEPILRAVAAS